MCSPAAEPLSDDVETLRAMLLAERQARSTEAHNQALLIEKFEHHIARLRHERFGQLSEHRALLDKLDALTDFASWGLVRDEHELSFEDACSVWVGAIDCLLTPAPLWP